MAGRHNKGDSLCVCDDTRGGFGELKRRFDFLSAAAALILLAPLLLALGLLVRLTSPGPVFHRGLRVGRRGRSFRILKFRSMKAGAYEQGPAVTVAGDPRVTPVGAFLRKTKLDELPQLLNVLVGEMSLVGPRPEDPRYVAQYNREQLAVLEVRPGITSPASVAFSQEESLLAGGDWERRYLQEIMPTKLAAELAYLDQSSWREDLRIMWKTAGVLVRR